MPKTTQKPERPIIIRNPEILSGTPVSTAPEQECFDRETLAAAEEIT
jgi:hypothetical protein